MTNNRQRVTETGLIELDPSLLGQVSGGARTSYPKIEICPTPEEPVKIKLTDGM